jgi:hypothetical protein
MQPFSLQQALTCDIIDAPQLQQVNMAAALQICQFARLLAARQCKATPVLRTRHAPQQFTVPFVAGSIGPGKLLLLLHGLEVVQHQQAVVGAQEAQQPVEQFRLARVDARLDRIP